MVDIEHLIGDVARKKLNSSLKVLNRLDEGDRYSQV